MDVSFATNAQDDEVEELLTRKVRKQGIKRSPLLKIQFTVLLIGFLLIIGIAIVEGFLLYSVYHSESRPPINPEIPIINLSSAKAAIIAYHVGGNYDSDLNALTAIWWDHFKDLTPGSKDTVVFDIDDTTLANYPDMITNDFGYIPKLWDDWLNAANASAIPQISDFYHKLILKNYTIIFLTARSVQFYNQTALNLQREKILIWNRLLCRGHDNFKTLQEFKANARSQLVREGLNIVGCIGDQFSDLNGGNTGYTMKVPNYCYFLA